MPTHDVIVIGASAGGVQALCELAKGLPADLPAAVFVVVHTSPTSPGILPIILDRAGPLPASHAVDGEPLRAGRIYVAPPDHHLLVKRDKVRVVHGPKENGFRPAADPLFRTAARAYGPRVIGVVLSGGLDDGTEGLLRIKEHGGVAVVQDPGEAIFPGMPTSAIQNVEVDHVMPVAQMAAFLAQAAKKQVPAERMKAAAAAAGNGNGDPNSGEEDLDVAEIGNAGLQGRPQPGAPSALTCPECGGALWETSNGKNGKLLRYRCHVGHGYSAEGLLSEHSRNVEAALWTALRSLEENADLRRRLAERSRQRNWPSLVRQYERQAADAEERAALLREVLTGNKLKTRASPKTPRAPKPIVEENERGRATRRGGNGAAGKPRAAKRRRARAGS